MGYYNEELNKAFHSDKPCKYARKIKVTSEEGNTNWLSLNDESASELVKYLKEHYNVK